MNKVYVLGVGPGSKEFIPPVTTNKIEKAEVLIGGERVLKHFNKKDKEKIRITSDLQKITDYIQKNYMKKQIAVLCSGDPGLYSFLKYLKRNFSEDYLEVIPGISSLQLAFARNKMVWQDAEIISLHGKDNRDKLIKAVSKSKKIALFTDDKNSPASIADYLLDNSIKDKNVLIAENLSYPEEKIFDGNLSDLLNKQFSELTVMVIY